MTSSVSCTVWWANLHMTSDRLLEILNDEERARCSTYRQTADRDRFIVGAAVLRLAVAAELGTGPMEIPVARRCAECGRPHGKPFIPGADVHVSVSHSGQLVSVAATRAGPVGVDVEEVTGVNYVPLLQQVLARSEEGTVRSSSDFFALWSRKESVVKATGDGLATPMSCVELSLLGSAPRLLRYDGEMLSAKMADLRPLDGYVAAATVLNDNPVDFHEKCAPTLLGAPGSASCQPSAL